MERKDFIILAQVHESDNYMTGRVTQSVNEKGNDNIRPSGTARLESKPHGGRAHVTGRVALHRADAFHSLQAVCAVQQGTREEDCGDHEFRFEPRDPAGTR